MASGDSFVSLARYTSPIPPTPICAVIAYEPRRVPESGPSELGLIIGGIADCAVALTGLVWGTALAPYQLVQ